MTGRRQTTAEAEGRAMTTKPDYGPTGVGRDGKLHDLEDKSRAWKADEARLSRDAGEYHSYTHTKALAFEGSHFLKSISTGKGALEPHLLLAWSWIRLEDEIANAAGLRAVDLELEGGGSNDPEARLIRPMAARRNVQSAVRHIGQSLAQEALLWSLGNPDQNIINLGRHITGDQNGDRRVLRATGIAWIHAALDRVEDYWSNFVRNS